MSTPLVSAEGRRVLLALARRATESALSGGSLPTPTDLADDLSRPAGAFVTLREAASGDLRGCVGFVEPRLPLWKTVAEAAVAAAIHDSRFPRVTRRELDTLSLQVSVLGPLLPIAPDDVLVGVHGLVARQGSRSGLLLPQVPLEQGWDRVQFLDHTCRKAGLPHDAWRHPNCALLAFTAEYFGE